jgi:hypothetical protein
MADQTHPQPHASLSIPPYLRPPITRHQSTSSNGSAKSHSRRPHPQHTEYIPSNPDIAVEVGVDDVFTERLLQDEAEDEAGESAFTNASAPSPGGPDWDNLRDGSIARRPAWRRPSPGWVYPFLIGMALAIGMTVAPRSELYINLACLSHPPRAPSSVDQVGILGSVEKRDVPELTRWEAKFVAWSVEQAPSINTTIPEQAQGDSPGDAWFRKIQHDIYEYERNKRLAHGNSTDKPSSTAIYTSRVHPTDPLPHATITMPGNEDPSATQIPSSPSATARPDPSSEENGRPPYREIDPKLCKKDPKVQAAAARLTMSEFNLTECIAITDSLNQNSHDAHWWASCRPHDWVLGTYFRPYRTKEADDDR